MSLRNDITGHVHEIHLLHRQGFCSRGEVAQAALGHFVSLLQGGNPWAERPDVECVRAIISSLLKDANEQEITEWLSFLYENCTDYDQYFLGWDADTRCISVQYQQYYTDPVAYDLDCAEHGLWLFFD